MRRNWIMSREQINSVQLELSRAYVGAMRRLSGGKVRCSAALKMAKLVELFAVGAFDPNDIEVEGLDIGLIAGDMFVDPETGEELLDTSYGRSYGRPEDRNGS